MNSSLRMRLARLESITAGLPPPPRLVPLRSVPRPMAVPEPTDGGPPSLCPTLAGDARPAAAMRTMLGLPIEGLEPAEDDSFRMVVSAYLGGALIAAARVDRPATQAELVEAGIEAALRVDGLLADGRTAEAEAFVDELTRDGDRRGRALEDSGYVWSGARWVGDGRASA